MPIRTRDENAKDNAVSNEQLHKMETELIADLVKIMEANDISQKDISEKADVTFSNHANLENQDKSVSIMTLLKLLYPLGFKLAIVTTNDDILSKLLCSGYNLEPIQNQMRELFIQTLLADNRGDNETKENNLRFLNFDNLCYDDKLLFLKNASDAMKKDDYSYVKRVPVDPSIAWAAKETMGKDFLKGLNLSHAEAKYGKDWLDS